MNYTDKVEIAKNELLKTGLFNSEELEPIQNDTYHIVFESWEYYQIFYLTNEDLYYSDEEFKDADLIEDTEKGRFFCYS